MIYCWKVCSNTSLQTLSFLSCVLMREFEDCTKKKDVLIQRPQLQKKQMAIKYYLFFCVGWPSTQQHCIHINRSSSLTMCWKCRRNGVPSYIACIPTNQGDCNNTRQRKRQKERSNLLATAVGYYVGIFKLVGAQ